MTKTTQGDRLIEALRRSWMTYGEMQRLGVSTSPQKRVTETLKRRRPDLMLLKVKGEDGLIRWRVARAKPSKRV